MHKHFCNNALPVDFATPHTPNFLLAHTVGLTLEEMQKAHDNTLKGYAEYCNWLKRYFGK